MKHKLFDVNSKKTIRGLGVMVLGIGLLLHTLGIIETGINLLLILASVGMITYGIITSSLHIVVQRILKDRYNTIKKKTDVEKKGRQKVSKKP